MTKFYRLALALTVAALMTATVGFGQSDADLRAEIKALKEGQAAIQKDVAAMLKILEAANLPQKPKPFELGFVILNSFYLLSRSHNTPKHIRIIIRIIRCIVCRIIVGDICVIIFHYFNLNSIFFLFSYLS